MDGEEGQRYAGWEIHSDRLVFWILPRLCVQGIEAVPWLVITSKTFMVLQRILWHLEMTKFIDLFVLSFFFLEEILRHIYSI